MSGRKVLVLEKAEDGWRVQDGDRSLAQGATKSGTLREAVRIARDQQPSSLKIKGGDGRIQEERTYPRGSDPKNQGLPVKHLVGITCWVVGVLLVAVGLFLSIPSIPAVVGAHLQFPSLAELAASVPFWIGVGLCAAGKWVLDEWTT